MIDEGPLLVIVAVEAILVVLALGVLVGHSVLVRARKQHDAWLVASSTRALARVVEGEEPERVDIDALTLLPASEQIVLFGQVSGNMVGAQKDRLAALAAEVTLLSRAHRWCASRRWGQRLRGARVLTLLGGGETVVPMMLDDPRPQVRAQAAQWAADHPTATSIDSLLSMLNDPETLCRFTVKDALLRVGRPATDPLLRYLSRTDGAPVADALDLAAGNADARFLTPALALCGADDAQTRARAAALAGSVGGSQATAALIELLKDSHPDVRCAAATALGKLGHWPAANALAGSLRDTSWDVRRAGAVALRAIGAPGVLLLRRALNDDDRFARDMARQVLELPSEQAAVRALPGAQGVAVPRVVTQAA